MAPSWVKHVAALDLGTNTFNLVISEVDNPFPPIYRAEKGVFLGKGGLKNKTILPDALLRAKKVLNEYSEIIKNYKVIQINAVATEAIRNANNSSEILEKLDHLIPSAINKISGVQEAELICLGVSAAGLLKDKTAMVIDIGGASTEVIIINNDLIKWLKSYKVGVSRALEIFPINDIPSEEDLFMLTEYFKSNMEDLNDVLINYQPDILIGTAGSFDSWRKIIETKNEDSVPYYKFDRRELNDLFIKINKTSLQERVTIKGIPELRKETIVPAGVLIQNLLDIYNFKTVYQCSYSLAEGLIKGMTEKYL